MGRVPQGWRAAIKMEKNPIALQALLLCWFVITVAVIVVLPFSQNSW